MMNWQKTLQAIVQDPLIHARFLNTLSLLEYVGARKILKSQQESSISMTVLSHAAEEIRHAQILKKLALKMAGSAVETYSDSSLIAGDIAKKYMQDIDQASEKLVGENRPWLSYLVTTLIIEERAEVFYPFYEQCLDQVGLSGPIKQIVRDEENHLEKMRELIQQEPLIDLAELNRMREQEAHNFNAVFTAIEKEMSRQFDNVVSPVII